MNPYKIEGPAIISFSGGRTSGFMLKQILDAHGGKLPDDVLVSFQNTGKEMPQTLDFIQECSERWDVPIVWLEYRVNETNKPTFAVVDHATASRCGEPLEAVIRKRKYLPNQVARFCTGETKVLTLQRYAKSIGMKDWDNVVGIRADEPRRIATMRTKDNYLVPLADDGVTKYEILDFWFRQPFNLELPTVNGTTPKGNCDLCYLKGAKTIMGIIREEPHLADWWSEMEKQIGATFRPDRPSYGKMKEMVQNQGDLFSKLPDDETIPCMCTD